MVKMEISCPKWQDWHSPLFPWEMSLFSSYFPLLLKLLEIFFNILQCLKKKQWDLLFNNSLWLVITGSVWFFLFILKSFRSFFAYLFFIAIPLTFFKESGHSGSMRRSRIIWSSNLLIGSAGASFFFLNPHADITAPCFFLKPSRSLSASSFSLLIYLFWEALLRSKHWWE